MRKQSRKTVLIVSTDPSGRHELAEMVREAGFRVAVAPGPREAVEQIQDTAVDVVVADVASPAGETLALLEELRQASSKLPVVIVSWTSDVELYLEAMNRGAFDYLVQPLSAQELLSVIHKAVTWSPRRRRAA